MLEEKAQNFNPNSVENIHIDKILPQKTIHSELGGSRGRQAARASESSLTPPTFFVLEYVLFLSDYIFCYRV